MAEAVNTLVVARYQEDISWVDDLDGWEPFVVTKGEDLPNEGRECSSFFWALANLKVQDTDTIAFVQGNPFDHGNIDLDSPVSGFRPLGDHHTQCRLDGYPHHPGLPIADYWRDWIGTEPPDTLAFTPGGQFVITGKLANSRDNYGWMQEQMSRPDAPWVMERLWGYYWYAKEHR